MFGLCIQQTIQLFASKYKLDILPIEQQINSSLNLIA